MCSSPQNKKRGGRIIIITEGENTSARSSRVSGGFAPPGHGHFVAVDYNWDWLKKTESTGECERTDRDGKKGQYSARAH